jgi:hypothetical protein
MSAENATAAWCSEQVDGARVPAQMGLAQAQVGGGGLDARMTQQNLHTANVRASFEHAGGKTLALMPSSA